MDEQELIEKYRLLYAENQKSYNACMWKHGPRPIFHGGETPEQLRDIRDSQEYWDNLFENDL